MRRVLLVDTNRASYPIYQTLVTAGYEVTVDGGNPSEPLAKLSENYVNLDYSNPDQLDHLVKENGFDFIVPGCTDVSYKVCAEINNGRFLGFDTLEKTLSINDKDAFRKIATQIGLSVPRVLSRQEAENSPAIIVKPVDAYSGKGIRVLEAPSGTDLDQALESASQVSQSGQVLLEEFVSGQLFSHSAFIKNGRIVADFVVREDQTANPFAVDTSRVVSEPKTEILEPLRAEVANLYNTMDLVDGLIHTQFIADGENYWIIEVTRRCPGDLYSLLIEYSTGYPYAANFVAPFLGESCSPISDQSHQENIIRHTISSTTSRTLWGLTFSRPVDIRLFVPLLVAGDELSESPIGRAGIVFFNTESKEEQDTLYEHLLDGSLYSLNN